MEWTVGAWQNSDGCRYQHAFIQRVRGRVETRRLERSSMGCTLEAPSYPPVDVLSRPSVQGKLRLYIRALRSGHIARQHETANSPNASSSM